MDKMIKNLTPHPIVLRSGDTDTTIAPSGTVARVSSTPGTVVGEVGGVPIYSAPTWGEVLDLPATEAGVVLIVSAIVAARCSGRHDVVSPGTGPNDGAIRDDAGRIVAVTRLIAAPKGEIQ
jgi:hypothetical protein